MPFCASTVAAQRAARAAATTKRLVTVGGFYNRMVRKGAVNGMVCTSDSFRRMEGRMKWTRLAIPLSALLMIAAWAPSASAQGTKKATGTISAVTGSSVTVKTQSGQDMTFSVDKDTMITTPGGGTKAKAAKAAGKAGVAPTDVLKAGQAVEVSYHETGGTMH